MKNVYSLFLSPRGRIGRISFLVGTICLLAFAMVSLYFFTKLGARMVTFFEFLIFIFLYLHITMCVYGKRLHDLGRSLWPLIGVMALMVIVVLLVGLNFGGIEYFDTVIAHPEYAGNEAEMQKVLKIYQDKLRANLPQAGWMMAVLPLVFTAWLAIKPGQVKENSYGLPSSLPK